MESAALVRIGDVCTVRKGTTITEKEATPGEIPVVAGGMKSSYFHGESNRQPGVIAISASGANAGYVSYWDCPIWASDCTTVEPTNPSLVSSRFVFNYLKSIEATVISSYRRGAAQPHVYARDLQEIMIPLPTIDEQQRIASILDAADELRTKRRQALAKLDTLTQAIFIDMFGDPLVNPMGWPMLRLGDLALKFSDGPFGSNLKSSHYVPDGVRVIRLQNIGVGQFVDEDKAFISPAHFATLSKHECLPGDVLVGTMGDPNLRACRQPEWLPLALNKADCVQVRPDPSVINGMWLCAVLNNRQTLAAAADLVTGQTRVRISMGRLRELKVPTPPVEMQRRFGDAIADLEVVGDRHRLASSRIEGLFASLQQGAFRGEL
jgi:type I restriction enzyme S subunit